MFRTSKSSTAVCGRTWHVQQQELHYTDVHVFQPVSKDEDARPHGTHECIEQVKHLLGGPAILWYTQVDAQQLHLLSSYEGVHIRLGDFPCS